MKNHPKFSILEKMVYNHREYFDKDVCLFLLKSIKTPAIKEKEIDEKNIKNFNISSNLWGQVLYENKNFYRMETGGNDYAKSCQDSKTAWENILNSIDADITQPPFYKLTKTYGVQKGNKYEVSINGLLALTEPEFWFTLYKKDPEKYALNKIEKYVLAEDLMETEQHYKIYSDNPDFKSYLLANVVENLAKLKKMFKNDEAFTNKMLSSENFKSILRASETQEIAPLFSLESLGAIIKKANLAENLAKHSTMLSDFMPIAPAQEWMNAHANKKKFCLSAFMSLVLNKTCGINYTELSRRITNNGDGMQRNDPVKKSRNAANEAFLRLDYISDSLKDVKLSEVNTMVWYASIMGSGNRNLFKKSLSIVEFPEKTEKNKYFFKTWYDQPVNVSGKSTETFIWSDVEKEYNKEKLESQLFVKTEKRRSPKI